MSLTSARVAHLQIAALHPHIVAAALLRQARAQQAANPALVSIVNETLQYLAHSHADAAVDLVAAILPLNHVASIRASHWALLMRHSPARAAQLLVGASGTVTDVLSRVPGHVLRKLDAPLLRQLIDRTALPAARFAYGLYGKLR